MFVLIGHGYVGKKIKTALEEQKLPHVWLRHNDTIPPNARAIINAAGFTGKPNVDACETHKQETIDGNVVFPVAGSMVYRLVAVEA